MNQPSLQCLAKASVFTERQGHLNVWYLIYWVQSSDGARKIHLYSHNFSKGNKVINIYAGSNIMDQALSV